MSEHNAENGAALAALGRLVDQAWNTAGNATGRERVSRDRATILAALTRSTTSKGEDELIRRIADCLEQHLPAFGFDPYRYPSGENKSVNLVGGDVVLSDVDGIAWRLTLTRVIPPA